MNHKLVAYRKLLNLKQKEVADVIGINSATFSQKERGTRDFTQSEMIAITELFQSKIPDITMHDIFFKDDVGRLLSS